MNYRLIQFNDGYVILFHGKGAISSAIIWFCSLMRFRLLRDWIANRIHKTKELYSHIGTAKIMTLQLAEALYEARDKDGKRKIDYACYLDFKAHTGCVYVFESTTFKLKVKDENGNDRILDHKGVRLVRLSDMVAGYSGKMKVRAISPALTKEQIAKDDLFIAEKYNMPYEKHLLELIGMGTPLIIGKENLTDYSCSELTTDRVKHWSWPIARPCNETSPQDYATGGYIDNAIRGTAYSLGEEVEIEK